MRDSGAKNCDTHLHKLNALRRGQTVYILVAGKLERLESAEIVQYRQLNKPNVISDSWKTKASWPYKYTLKQGISMH